MPLVNMQRHFFHPYAHVIRPVNRKRPTGSSAPVSDSRIMATNQGNLVIENPSYLGLDNLIMEALERLVQGSQVLVQGNRVLIQENQALSAKVEALNAKVGAIEMQMAAMRIQMTEMMGILQTLKNGTTTEATAVVNPGGAATILPTMGPTEAVTAIPHPGSGVNHPAHTLGDTHLNSGGYPQDHQFENSQPQDQLHELEKRLKTIEDSKTGAKDARDLCLVPDLVIPPKMKVPDFDKYRGTSCPDTHLTMYVRRMTAYAHDDKLLIHYFQYSLAGGSRDWYMQLQPSDIHSWKDLSEAFLKEYEYNRNMAPDRAQLQHMSKKEDESFREYAQRWRSIAAQVKPPLTEKEMVHVFMETLPAFYYDRLIGSVSTNFSDMATVGERIEVGIKRGRISCNLAGTVNVSGFPAEKDGGTNAIMGQRRSSKFSPIPMSYTDLCGHLVNHNLISLREMKPVQPPFPRGYDSDARCDFHSGAIGHSTEKCKPFKYLVQELIDTKQLAFNEDGGILTVNLNP